MAQLILDNDARVSLVGRYDDLGAGNLSGWGGSQRRFSVTGTVALNISCAIVDTGAGTNSYVGISVDYGDVDYIELTTVAEAFTGTRSHSFTLPDTGAHDIILWYMMTPAAQWEPTVDKIILESISIDDAATLTAWPQVGPLDVGAVGASWSNWIYSFVHHLDPVAYSVWPVSAGGQKASDLDVKVDYIYNGKSEEDPALDFVIIASSINDYIAGTSLAAFEASLSSVVDKVRVQQPSAIIILPQFPDNTGAGRIYSQYGPNMDVIASSREGVYYNAVADLPSVVWEADNAHLDYDSNKIFADYQGDFIAVIQEQIMSGKIYKINGQLIRSFGDINYSVPIPKNAGGAYSPFPGDHITSTSKLLTVTSSSGTVKFWPKGGLTSRVFWGTGASAAATLTLNPENLTVGSPISVTLYGGESCVWVWDGTDFTKDRGNSIPCIAKIGEDDSTSTPISIANATLTVIPCNKSLLDNTGQMVSVSGNGSITPIRDGVYIGGVRAPWVAGTGGTDDHQLQHRIMHSGGSVNMINLEGVWAQSVAATTMPLNGTEGIALTTSEVLEFHVRHQGATAESLSVYRNIDTTAQFWFQITEVDPY